MAAVNSRARRVLQRFALLRLAEGPQLPGRRALEIGLGSGYGTRMILDRFRAARVDAIDLDPTVAAKVADGPGRVLAVGDDTSQGTIPSTRHGPTGAPHRSERPLGGSSRPARSW